jgi:hypothetical protein
MLNTFETNHAAPVSVTLDMNAKATRTVLNVAFKQVQRLPDWPPMKLNNSDAAAKIETAGKFRSCLSAQPLAGTMQLNRR